MSHARAVGRLSILAVGLGIGAAAAATSPTAAAAPTMPVDPVPVVPDLAVPAATNIPGLDLSISFDGMSLFQSGSADAVTGTGNDFAIAFGALSVAGAGENGFSGTSNTAWAFGNHSEAFAGDGNFNNAVATDFTGVGGFAEAGGGSSSLLGNNDNAFYLGPAPSGHDTGVLAGWVGGDTTGNNDIAAVLDPFGPDGSSALAGHGDFNLGAAIGDGLHSTGATGANFLVEILPFFNAI